MKRIGRSLVAAAALLLGLAQTAGAQDAGVKATYVPLASGVPGVLYEPAMPGPKSRIALFVMHASGDYLRFSACTELSKRGYRVLCTNNSTSKSGAFDDGVFDKVLLQAKLGVAYLRALPGVEKVVLFGHSGGGTIMTAYQAIAEQGIRFCQAPNKIVKCPDTLAGLPRADGVVLADPNWGQASMTLLSIDPAVTSETSGTKLNPALDMFNPANGFKPDGSTYSADFIRRFLAAEGRRNNAIVARAQGRLAAIEAGKGDYSDDEMFVVPGASFLGFNNKLYSQDVRLLSQTQRPYPLLHKDGTSTTGIVHTVRVPENTRNRSPELMGAALKTTVRSFLNTYAIRVEPNFGYDEDSFTGVDWTSSYASSPGNAEGITAPFLALGMTGHWEMLAAETIHDHAKSADRTLAFVEGAGHTYTPCTKCETTPGQFGDTVKTLYDYVDGWLSKPGRFGR